MKRQAVSAAVLAIALFWCGSAQAVQIKGVQSGWVRFPENNANCTPSQGTVCSTRQTITLPNPVDATKAISLYTVSGGDISTNVEDENWFFTTDLSTNGASMTIERAGATNVATVYWQVVEFVDGVIVQRNTTIGKLSTSSIPAANQSVSFLLASITDVNKALPIIQTRAAYTTETKTDEIFLLPRFVAGSPPQLILERPSSNTLIDLYFSWQVVQFTTDATVQTGVKAFPAAASSTKNQSMTATLSSPVGKGAALFIYFSGNTTATSGIDGVDNYLFTTGQVTPNTTTVTLTRGLASSNSSDTANVRYYVVDFTDGATNTQSGTQSYVDPTSPREMDIATSNYTMRIAYSNRYSTGSPIRIWTGSTCGYNANGTAVTSTSNCSSHHLSTGDTVTIQGHKWQPAANGTWQVTRNDDYSFTLNGSSATTAGNTYTVPGVGVVKRMTSLGASTLSNIVITTGASADVADLAPHGLSVGDRIHISGHVLQKAAEGVSTVKQVIDVYSFTLDDSFVPGPLLGTDTTPPTDAQIASGKIGLAQMSPLASIVDPGRTLNVISSRMLDEANVNSYLADDLCFNAFMIGNQLATVHTAMSGYNFSVAYQMIEFGPLTVANALEPIGVTVNPPYTVGDAYKVKWILADSVKNHSWRLDISQDGGTNWASMPAVCGPAYNAACSGSVALGNPLSVKEMPMKIPDKIGTNVMLRLVDTTLSPVNDANIYKYSDATTGFEIKRGLALTSPVGGENWVVGNKTIFITWNYRGETNFGTVKLEYSTNGGGTWTSLATAVPRGTGGPFNGTGSYLWNPSGNGVPDLIGTNLKVRVTSESDATVSSASPLPFNIKRSITLTAPTGASSLSEGTAWNIQWTYTGEAGWGTVALQYSNSGGTWTNIATAQSKGAGGPFAGTGSYTASNIPSGAVGSSIQVRVFSESDNTVVSTSPSFSVEPNLRLDSPNGGETWAVSETRSIAWTRGTAMNNAVKIDYSTNGGSTWTTIVASTPSKNVDATHGSYSWSIPSTAVGTNDKIRLTDVIVGSVTDSSDAVFTVNPKIDSVSPGLAANESYDYSSDILVQWNAHGMSGTVNVLLSSNGGTSYTTTLASSIAASAGQWTWSTGLTGLGTTYKIRVISTANANVYGDSANNFRIRGKVTVVSPNGGEAWKVGETRDISWNQLPAALGNVDIQYSLNNGGSWFPIATNAAGACVSGFCTYTWTLDPVADPNIKTSTQALVKVTKNSDTAVTDSSDGNFSIKGNLKLASPVGGETWDVASSHAIVWVSSPISQGNIKLEYLVNGAPTVITASGGVPSSDQTYNWTVPDAISSLVKVRVTSLVDPTITDTSAANFTIKPKFTVTVPNGGETWFVGEARTISWTNTGTVNTVNLYSSFNGGSSWNSIVSGLTNLQSYDLSASGGVPDNIGTTNRIKVESAGSVAANDISDTNYTIKGKITVTSPNGLETLHVADIFPITWDYKGTLGNVNVLYSTDGGATYPASNLIATVPASNKSYPWTVPDAIGTNVKVKVMQTGAAPNDAFDESDQAFSIKGTITAVTSPAVGDKWIVGTVHPITWTTKGTNMGNVKIEYSTDGGTNYVSPPITPAGGVSADLPFNWTVPDKIFDTVKVKVTLLSDSTASAQSSLFSIKGSLALTAPTASSVWSVGFPQNITWTRNGTMGNVKIEYSTDGGVNYPSSNLLTPAAGVPSNSSPFNWTIPDAIGNQVKVRVTLLSDSTTSDESLNFMIKGSLTLTAPTGSSVWSVGSPQNITWIRNGSSMGNVKIEYSTDGGVNYPSSNLLTPAAGVPSNSSPFNWTIPDAIGNQVKVRVTLLSDSTTSDASPNFMIKGSLTLTSPQNGNTWIVGSSHAITWTKNGTMGNVKLEYSRDNGATFPFVINAGVPAGNLTQPWTVPDAIGNQVRVKITLLSDAATSDTSQAFSIKGSFALTSPNGGETWPIGENRPITWTTNGTMANVKLSYSTDGGVSYGNVIAAATANTSPYTWLVPDAAGNALRVKVEDATDPAVSDASDANFTVKGSVAVTAPASGVVWTVGSTHNIVWTANGTLGPVRVDYSKDNGATYSTVVASVPASDLKYTWTVPDAISNQVKVKVTLISDASVMSETANFSIKGSFGLVSPTAGDAWEVGTIHPITWTHNGSMGKVKLEYSTDSGVNYPNLITPVGGVDASLDTLNWAVPDDISDHARVKITLLSDTSVSSESSQDFSIKGKLTLASPVASDAWAVGSVHAITWNKAGSMGNVKIEYSTVGGTAGSYLTITPAGGVPSSSSPFSWTIPDAVTNQAKVKITLLSDSSVTSESPLFSIKGGLVLSSPVGGENWVVGDDHAITWTKTGTMGNVKIEYSTDGGATYPNALTPVAGVPSYSSPFNWTIPDAIGNKVRVKVSLLSDLSVKSESANFSIKGALALTSPVGGESWTVGDTHPIAWTKVGSLGNVKIEYSTDGGATYANTIAASVPAADLTLDWAVPDAIGTQLKVKITSISDPSLKSESGVFAIHGSLTLASPAGGENWIVGTSQTISWDKTGTLDKLKVEYSLNGAPYATVAAGVAASSGSYDWTVPDTIGRVRVKITLESDANVNSESNLFFIKGLLTLSSPTTGDSWSVGSAHAITWTKTGTMGNVKLEYSTDGGTTYPNLITTAAGIPSSALTYNWTVPNSISNQVRVKMTLLSDSSTYSESPVFQIKGGLVLSTPVVGNIWGVGTSHAIQWTRTGTMGDIKIEYSVNSQAYGLIAQVPSVDGSYNWTVPDDIGSTKVKISLVSDTNVFSESPSFFIKGNFSISSPNGGETWVAGDTHDITWSTTGSIAYVNLYYTANSAALPVVWVPINAVKAPNAPLYHWTIPDTLGNKVKVKIEDASDATVMDESDANFKISGHIDMIYPKDGGESWIIGSTANVTWAKRGSFPFVKVEYSTNSGSTYNFVATTDATTGTYAWTIPDAAGSHVKVRISNADDATTTDVSLADSVIRAGFHFTVPAGGESWPVASAQTIRWTTGGTVSRVNLQYSVDDGATYSNFASNVSNNGSYSWTIPDAISDKVRVKVADTSDPVASDVSPSFKIQGVLTLASPHDGDRWSVGSSPTISWNKTGGISQVKLEYRKDQPGAAWTPITPVPVDAAPSSFQWTLPDSIEDFIEIKVSDAAANDADAFATAKVKVIGQLTMTSPAGGERWVTFEQHNIIWNTKGTVPKVNVEYSHNDFAASTMIIAGADNTGSYAWTVPDPGIANVPKSTKIRVTDASEPASFVTSNAFNIDYYNISWEVRDLVTNLPISALTVLETKSGDPNSVQWQEVGVTVSPPRVEPTPYGRWSATWTKAGYGDASYTVIATQDQSITLYMESVSSHIWRAESQVSYNPVNDIADVSAWLEKDGAVITTATAMEFEVYQGSTLVTTVNGGGIDGNGFFHTTVPAGNLHAGNTYTTITKITIASGAVFKTPSSFEITTPATLQEMKNAIVANLDKPLSQINAELQMTLAAQTQTINQKLDTQTAIISTSLGNQTAVIQNTLTSFESKVGDAVVNLETGAKQSLDASKQLEKTASKFSWKAGVSPNPAITDGTILLQVQGPTGLLPYVSIYNSQNRQIVSNAGLKEQAVTPGVYAYEFKATAADFPAGQSYTYIVTEDTTGALVAGSGSVESVSLTTIASLASSGAGAEQAAREAVSAIKDLETNMTRGGDVRKALLNLQTSVNELPSQVAKLQGQDSKKIGGQVKEISDRLQKLAGEQGLDFHDIFKAAIDDSSTIQDIRGRSEEISKSVDILGAVVQKRLGGEDEPVVATILE